MNAKRALLAVALTALAAHSVGRASGAAAPGAPARPPQIGEELPTRPELQAFQGVRGWLVNGTEIKLDEVRDRAVLYHGPYVLQDMVAELLLQDEAQRRGVTVSDAEVDEKIKELRAEGGLITDMALEYYLRKSRVTPGWLREKARAYVLMEKLLGEQVYVSDREVEALYNQFRELYRKPEAVDFRVISVPNEKQAQAALAELRGGRSFQQVAQELAAPENKAAAGDIHTYEKGQRISLPPELEAALFAAPLNQVAGPIKAANFYHLIRVEKKSDAYQFSLDEVRETVRDQLRKQKLEQAVWPNWIKAQLAGAEIETLKAE